MPATSSARPADAAVQVRREVEAVEEVEGRADDQRVHERAEARALAERRGEHEHDERHDDDRDAEAQARVIEIAWCSTSHGPRPTSARTVSSSPQPYRSSAAIERGEAHAGSRRAGSDEGASPRHHGCAARRYAELAGQAAARPSWSRGKSGHRRAGCWVTPRRGNPTESATERTPPKRPSAVAGKGEKVR